LCFSAPFLYLLKAVFSCYNKSSGSKILVQGDLLENMGLKTHSFTLKGERIVLRPMTENDWPLVEKWET
jgi:hypothetical protein